jgi:hypothetical protein
MNDFLWDIGLYYPGWLEIFRAVFYVGVGVFIGLVLGSVRWWWIKRTRLPLMWNTAREEYEREIAHWKGECDKLDVENGRLSTAAYGSVVMQFRSAVQKKVPHGAMMRARG